MLFTYPVGVHPDGLAFSPNGEYLIAVNEGEAYRYNSKKKSFESPPGSVTHVHLSSNEVTQIALSDYTNVEDMLNKKHARRIEREVIGGNQKEMEIGLKNNTPENTEPENITFNQIGDLAYVSLQENNGVLVIDVKNAKIKSVFGLGTTEHMADLKSDNRISFSKKLTALREPDGLSIVPDGKWLITADEGDTSPKVTKKLGGTPAGGGRTVSIFDAINGKFIADTQNQLDEKANQAGIYPDERSENKGSEPENVVSFTLDNKPYAVVGLERANGAALIDISDPQKLNLLNVVSLLPKGGQGPVARKD